MVERDPRAKYRVLPLNIDSDDIVLEVNAEVTGVEQEREIRVIDGRAECKHVCDSRREPAVVL